LQGNVSEAAAGALKLYLEDKVSAIVYGGTTGAENEAVANFAQSKNLLYASLAGFDPPAMEKYKSAHVSGTVYGQTADPAAEFTNTVLKPKTVGILAANEVFGHSYGDAFRKHIEEAGGSIVFEQYTGVEITDYTSILTKIKYANPDVLTVFYSTSEPYLGIVKQIMEIGGWGNIKVDSPISGRKSSRQVQWCRWLVHARAVVSRAALSWSRKVLSRTSEIAMADCLAITIYIFITLYGQ